MTWPRPSSPCSGATTRRRSSERRRGLEEAWPHVRAILRRGRSDRALFLAAIEAATTVGPDPQLVWEEVGELQDVEDEEIAEAAREAVWMSEALHEGRPPDTSGSTDGGGPTDPGGAP